MTEKEYWQERCFLAEDFITKSPCDNDIFPAQLEAYNKWCDFIENELINDLRKDK